MEVEIFGHGTSMEEVFVNERQLGKSSNYSFSYGVKDMNTGDVKDQWEKKEGDTVKGQYSMMEADGSIRTVEYVADKEHGFHAYVKYNGNSQHPISSSHQQVRMKAEKAPIKNVKPSIELVHKPSESRPQPSVVNLKPTKKTPPTTKKPLRKENEKTPTVQFPLDLSFLESNSKVIPVDISKLTPVEIKVKNEFAPQQQQQYKKQKPTDNRFAQQLVETDFQPIISNLTYKVNNNKKPLVTPGLRSYVSSPNIKLALQQEIHGNAYKYFPEKRPNYYIQRPRQTVMKNGPTLTSIRYL